MTDDKLVAKLARACVGIGNFQADKRNTQQNYNYISADQVLSRVGAALAAEGVMIIPAITEEIIDLVQPKPNQSRYDALVSLEMTITDGNEAIIQQWLGRGSDYSVPDKALYKAITSGHKYFLMKLFNIGVGNDDSEHEAEQPQQRVQARQPQAQVTEPLPEHAIADLRASIEGAGAKVKLGFICDRAAMTGTYSHLNHALNATRQWEGWPDGFDAAGLKATQSLPVDKAVELFDWLITRKDE